MSVVGTSIEFFCFENLIDQTKANNLHPYSIAALLHYTASIIKKR